MLPAGWDESGSSIAVRRIYYGEVCSQNCRLLLQMAKTCSGSSPSTHYFLFIWILGKNEKRAKTLVLSQNSRWDWARFFNVSGYSVFTRWDLGPSHCKILTAEHFFYIVCVMSSRDYLGEFEHIVVLALLRLGDRAYGVTVRQEIELRIGREVSIGAIYATLGRLETKGYVNSYLGDPTPERGGRSKRFFRVTAKGVAAVNRTLRALRSMTEGLRLARRYSQ